MQPAYKHKIICFIGIDGSGKTTLAKNIVTDLRNDKINAKYVYGKFRPVLSKPFVSLGKNIFLKDKDITQYNSYSDSKKEQLGNHRNLSNLYKKIIIIDYHLQVFFKIKLPVSLGKVVICDRYIFDTAINDIPRENDDSALVKGNLEGLLRFAPYPDLIFLIDIPEEIAFSRKDDTPSVSYLQERREIYKWLSRDYAFITIDGTKPIDEIQNQVRDRLYS